MPGHEIHIGDDYVVLLPDDASSPRRRVAVPGGCDVRIGDETHAIRYAWRFGDILMNGTCNGVPFAVQVERPSLQLPAHAHGHAARVAGACRAAPPSS